MKTKPGMRPSTVVMVSCVVIAIITFFTEEDPKGYLIGMGGMVLVIALEDIAMALWSIRDRMDRDEKRGRG